MISVSASLANGYLIDVCFWLKADIAGGGSGDARL